MLCQHSPSDTALWHTSVKLQHSAQALLIEQFLLNGKKPTQPYRASRPRSIAAVADANQTVCFLVVLASLGPDLVLTFHVPHGEIRSLVPNVSTSIPVIKIVATNSSSFQLYRIVVSLWLRQVQLPIFPSRSCQPRTLILARVFRAQSGVCALRLFRRC